MKDVGFPFRISLMTFPESDLSNIISDYVGRYGIDRTEYYTTFEYNPATKTPHLVLRSRTVTDWHRVSGTVHPTSYPFGTKWSQIYAGFVYPRFLIEQVLPIDDVDKLEPLTKEMVGSDSTKKIVYPHEMNIAFALEKISSRLQDAEKSRIRSYLLQKYKADHSEIFTLDVKLELASITLHNYYVPAYIYETIVSDLCKYQIINAHTGNVDSNKIYSVVKSAFLGIGIGGLVTFGFTVLTRPYLLPVEIATKLLIGSSVSGIFAGIMAKLSNWSNSSKDKSQRETDEKLNDDYIETEDDVERRKFSKMINEKFEYVTKNNHRFPIDKLRLLKLETEENITLEKLKTAYHIEIKKWHPDTNPNKDVAQNMTKQIILAYKELEKIIQKNKN